MNQLFTNIASRISFASGRAVTFILAVMIIIVWGLTGPLFSFSDTWQLVVNTGTTIITFLMVFLIQNTQNRDSTALQAKLDELLRAVKGAREKDLVGVEHLTDDHIEKIRDIVEKESRSNHRKPGGGKTTSHGSSVGAR
ncbi:MAG TPA: low affinity iron permease family protein [Sphingomicrobium sp.]|nr:low affinity iron permease family protein [Sphingomicrobium sp.]